MCACVFIHLDVWLIHDLLFYLIVSSRASHIKLESFLLRWRGVLSVGVVYLLEKFWRLLHDGFGRQIKTQFEGLRSPLEILVPSFGLHIHESFLTSIFVDFRLLLDSMHFILSFLDGLFWFEMVSLWHLFLL